MRKFFMNERNIMIAILLNAVIIFFLYFPSLKHDMTLTLIDDMFILFFLIEAIVKIIALGPKGYFANGWNRFDFFLVLFSIPTFVAYFTPIPHIEFIMILRLFRLIRLVRYLQFIPRIESIMSGIGRALKASLFVLIALFFLNFILALVTCHFYGEKAPQFFGDPMISAYTIFQLFTIEGWNEIPAVIAEDSTSWIAGISRFYFALIVLFGGIFGMSLANAVFVDEMTMDNNAVLEEKIDNLHEEIRTLKNMLKKD